MTQSAEVRWFYRDRIPGPVSDWFCDSRLCAEQTSRTDHYLALTGSNEVAVKVREGDVFQIKARTQAPQPFALMSGIEVGRQDAWVKWLLGNGEAAARMYAVGKESSEWVPVTKKRWLRKFSFDVNGEVAETDVDARTEHGCTAELSELEVIGAQWWTLAFESFGEVNRSTYLEQVARHVLRIIPEHGLVLTQHDSMAYPEWLNRMTK